MESFHNTPCAKKFFSHNLSKINLNQGLTNGGFEDNEIPLNASNQTQTQSLRGGHHQNCRFRCSSGMYSMLLISIVFVMLSPTVLSSPLFSASIKVDESDENILNDREYQNDLETPETAMLSIEEDENENENLTQTQPKWINPCGISKKDLDQISSYDNYPITPLSDYEILQNVLLTTRNALGHSRHFKDHYVLNTFRSANWKTHHEAWKNMHYEWLHLWPKHLGAEVHKSHLENLKVDTTLKSMYNNLQRLAAGLEQVVQDQNTYEGKYLEEFSEAEFKLKAVLCELQIAMLEKGITPDEDIDRSVMSPEVREIQDETYRNLRDWYIYRDYMNGLEYAVHAFKHLGKQHHVKRSSPRLYRESKYRRIPKMKRNF